MWRIIEAKLKKNISLFVVVVLLSGFLMPQIVYASSDSVVGNIISFAAGALLSEVNDFLSSGIQHVLAKLLALAGEFVDFMFYNSPSLISNDAVLNGLKITTGIVNSLFMIVALAIAFGMIITGGLNYNVKSALARLFIVALFVNFGVYLALFVVDFANVLTFVFLDPISSTGGTLSTQLAQGVNLSNAYSQVSVAIKNTANTESQIFLFLIVTIINFSLLLFIFLYMGIILFFRNIFLIVLIILFPFALFSWIFDKSHFSRWMEHFTRWAFFPAILSFFIYIAFFIFNNTVVSSLNTLQGNLGSDGEILSTLYTYISITVLMFMAIVLARSFHISPSQVGRYGKMLGLKVGLGALAGTWLGVKMAGRKLEETGAHKDTAQQRYTPTALERNIGLRLSKIPGLKKTGVKLVQRADRVREEKLKKVIPLTDETLKNVPTRGLKIGAMMTAKDIPIIRELIKRASQGDNIAREYLNQELRQPGRTMSALKLAEKYGDVADFRKELARFNPEILFKSVERRIDELSQTERGRRTLENRYGTRDPELAKRTFLERISRYVTPEDFGKIKYISPEFLDKLAGTKGFNNLIKGALKEGNENVINVLNRLIPKLNEELTRGLKDGATEAEKIRMSELRKLMGYLNSSAAKELLVESGITEAKNIVSRESRLRSILSNLASLSEEERKKRYGSSNIDEIQKKVAREVYKGITPEEFSEIREISEENMKDLIENGIVHRSHIVEALKSGSEELISSISSALSDLISNISSLSKEQKSHVDNLIRFLMTEKGEELLQDDKLISALNGLVKEEKEKRLKGEPKETYNLSDVRLKEIEKRLKEVVSGAEENVKDENVKEKNQE